MQYAHWFVNESPCILQTWHQNREKNVYVNFALLYDTNERTKISEKNVGHKWAKTENLQNDWTWYNQKKGWQYIHAIHKSKEPLEKLTIYLITFTTGKLVSHVILYEWPVKISTPPCDLQPLRISALGRSTRHLGISVYGEDFQL